MSILIKQAKIIAEGNSHHLKTMDVLIEGGKISKIAKSIEVKGSTKVIEQKGLFLSAGWFDLQAVACDPGYEFKEDLESMIKCAAAGGFTGVCIHNNNTPSLSGKSQIEYIKNKTINKVVDVFPLGTITVDAKGKELSEMFDMTQSGALAFSDHKHPIKDSGVLMRALQYSNNANTFIITHCNDESISLGGQMNEGEVSVSLGLKGIPALAEEIMIERNISVLEYAGGKMHIPTVSTKAGLDLIKKAKSAGLKITAGVSSINLLLDESALKEFDTNFKVDPPLRSKKDVQAIRNAVINGWIDVIVSDHLPQDNESKELEFDLAENGIINLQTAFNTCIEALGSDALEQIIKGFTSGPRDILGINNPDIEEGETANLTLFTLDENFTLTEKNNYSQSKNSPFLNRTMKGKVIGVLNGSKQFFN
ncbi:MAG: dihydroorotase [Sphingobacteriaceae bacterium]|nr:dihydroorotase [Sphingobacteriaceae bacterium]